MCPMRVPARRRDSSTGYAAVSANSAAGGLVGTNGASSPVSNSVSYGQVSGSGYIGGFVGSDQSTGEMSNDSWDMTTSGITDPSEGAGNVANDPGITGFN